MLETKFYIFRQNNSGGYWDEDKRCGIDQLVVIERDSKEKAILKFQSLLEEYGYNSDDDCPCCGSRWYENDVSDTYNSKDEILEYLETWEYDTYIHYISGEKEHVTF